MFDTVLDAFNRVNQQPLGGGWNAAPIYNPGLGTFRVVSNELANDAGGGIGGQYWDTQFGPDIETFVTIGSVKQPGDNSEQGILYARAQNVGTTSLDGYILYFFNNGTTERFLKLYREDDGNDTLLAPQAWLLDGNFDPGDKIGIRVIGNNISAWENRAGAGWVQRINANDSTHIGLGYCGFVLEDGNTARFDNFGGGTIAPLLRPQIGLLGRSRGGG